MTNDQKLVAICITLPIIAEYMEDILKDETIREDFKQRLDKHLPDNMKTIIKKIYKQNTKVMSYSSDETIFQQIDFQTAIKNFFKENIITQ